MIHGRPSSRCRFALAAFLAAGFARSAPAEQPVHFTVDVLVPREAPPAFRLDAGPNGLTPGSRQLSPFLRHASLTGNSQSAPSTPFVLPPAGAGEAPRPSWVARKPWLVLGGFTVSFLGLEYLAFWASAEKIDSFEFVDEGWLGASTYAGGADKASHLVGGYIAGRVAEAGLRRLGTPDGKAQLLSAALIGITGTLVEVGDAYHSYGFSWQDALFTAAGGVAGSLLAKTGWDDTITMRFGKVGVDEPDDPSLIIGAPDEYSSEMYTIDLRFAGLFPRLKADPGWARYLLFSATYGSKGYGGFVQEWVRQRLLGFEIGLDLYELVRALGVPPDTWWGGPILGFFRYFRVPFTGIGFQIELNSGRVKGPNSFHRFDF